MSGEIYARLSTLASPIRTRILRLLEQEELRVGEVAQVVQQPQPTVSRHLKALLDDGWLVRRREGARTLYAMAPELGPHLAELWAVVRGAIDAQWQEDDVRLAAALAARDAGAQAFFGRVAEQWQSMRRKLFGEAHVLPALLALLPEGLVVADLGCGPGDFAAGLARAGVRVIAIDREPAMLEVAARQLDGLSSAELRRGDLTAPPLAASEIDVAVFHLVLHLVHAPEQALAAAAAALRPGGAVVVLDMIAHDRREYRRTMGHVHLGFGPERLAEHAGAAGLELARYDVLTPDPEAAGPVLFLARLVPTRARSA